jgi:cation diffusion facilitator family transporter
MLILVGSVVIAFEAVRRLVVGGEVDHIGLGVAVVAGSALANVVVARHLARRARETGSPALEADAAHLRTDALTSGGVLLGLVLVGVSGASWVDSVVALVVAGSITVSGIRILMRSSRVLVDEALPEDELEAIRDAIMAFGDRGVAGFHALRARRAGARRYVDLHVQFRSGITLERAHWTAHELQDAIRRRLAGADVLIHLEPEDRVQPGTEVPPVVRGG